MQGHRGSCRRLEQLFELHEQRMFRIALAILHDEGQAEDAVMQAFERIVRTEGLPVRPDSDDAARLCGRIVKSCAIDLYRKNARTRQHEMLNDDFQRFDDESPSALSDGCDEADSFMLHDGADSIWESVDTLPARYRDIIVERFKHGLSTKETAEKLGISEGTVRVGQHRAIGMLRSKLSHS